MGKRKKRQNKLDKENCRFMKRNFGNKNLCVVKLNKIGMNSIKYMNLNIKSKLVQS